VVVEDLPELGLFELKQERRADFEDERTNKLNPEDSK